MLDGTRLDELERRLGLEVRALDFEGLARMVAAG
jgi:NifB/MoaA-like Fe-S oxidoreductase